MKTKSSLSNSRRQLIQLMQVLNFGKIKNLAIRDGEPVLDPAPKIIHESKLGADHAPRLEVALEDFVLKRQVTDLLDAFDRIGNGVIECVEVQHGLPFRMIVSDDMT